MKKSIKKIRYLFEYFIVIIVIKLLKLFDISTAANICSFLARKVGVLLGVNKVARQNLQMIFSNNIDIEKTLDEIWDNFGRFIGEFVHIQDMDEQELEQRIEIIGQENIAKFKKNNQPFLLFTGHFANWDIALKLIHKFYPKFSIIYRKANNPYVNAFINKRRASDKLRLIPKGPNGSKSLITAIKKRESIAMLVDQKMNDGIEVPFLGHPAMTPHAIAKIALQLDYPIVPCQIIRKKGSYFKVIVHPPLKFTKGINEQNDYYNIMLNINQILGDWIKQNPSQWFWFHNRWKK